MGGRPSPGGGRLRLTPLETGDTMRAVMDKARTHAADEAGAPPEEEISGVVNRVVFHSDDTGYTVCGIAARGHKDEVMVVGNCPAIWNGETLKAVGRWGRHKQHGLQFQAREMHCYPPATSTGIERFLASGLIRGIGPVMAERLVKEFGDRTLEVIDRESRRLEEVDGIGPVRREQIKQSWNQQRAVRDIMVFLQAHGVGPAHAMRIYKQYGAESVAVVRENPYRLCADVWGIGFKTADRIAMSLGVAPQSDLRARAGVLYVLQTLSEEGHCFCPREDLVAAAGQLLEIPGEILLAAVRHGVEAGTLVDERGNLFLRPLYEAETGTAAHLRRLLATRTSYPPIQAEKAVAWAEERMRLTFAPAQKAALMMALSSKVAIITGGPGVGKTTIVRALVDIFRARRLNVCLAAPTGRAAKRMEEATRAEAKTLHRLLKFNPTSGGFDHGPGHPLDGDVFILDEVSMIDIALAQAFLGALPDAAVLVLVGDADQLPSVGPGNVLRDLLECGTVPVTKLETIYRQGAQSAIVSNAHRVNSGLPFEPGKADSASDFFFLAAETPDEVIRKMLDLVTDRIPRKFRFNPMTEIQVLTPMRRNELGSENLNMVLQAALNPGDTGIRRFGRQYKPGDRVLQVRNNYDKDVYNGDIGLIDRLDVDVQELVVTFDGRRVPYAFDELDELDLAYACSVHKSQGSEYPAVVLLLTTQHFKLLQRNLLYTAMTRGRKLVCLVGSAKAVNMAIRNNDVGARRTALRERMQLRV